jgi:methylmalonyl-CoA/ethylmalonyl-CoA epimerase
MITGIFGINIAVRDLAQATARYESVFGVKAQPMGAGDFAFPGLVGSKLVVNGVALTLLASTDPNTSVSKFIEKKGEGVFLLSVAVDDIDGDVEALKTKGIEFVLPKTVSGAYGAVNFAHPKCLNGVQVEIFQPPKG